MEAIVIRINGRDYCKLVDKAKVEERRLETIATAKAFLEISKKQFKKIEIL